MQQIQLAQAKNRLSEIARLAQGGETFELTVRGVAVARITPVPNAPDKQGFGRRVMARMEKPDLPRLDIRAALADGRR